MGKSGSDVVSLTLYRVGGERGMRAPTTFVFADKKEVDRLISAKKTEATVSTYHDEGGRRAARSYMVKLLVLA